MNEIHLQIVASSTQDRDLSCYARASDAKVGTLHCRIHWDSSYPAQSYAWVKRWDGTQWHEVFSLLAHEVCKQFKDAKMVDVSSALGAQCSRMFTAAKEIILCRS